MYVHYIRQGSHHGCDTGRGSVTGATTSVTQAWLTRSSLREATTEVQHSVKQGLDDRHQRTAADGYMNDRRDDAAGRHGPHIPEGASGMSLLVEWSPGASGTPSHRHSGPAFGYVIESEVRFDVPGDGRRRDPLPGQQRPRGRASRTDGLPHAVLAVAMSAAHLTRVRHTTPWPRPTPLTPRGSQPPTVRAPGVLVLYLLVCALRSLMCDMPGCDGARAPRRVLAPRSSTATSGRVRCTWTVVMLLIPQ